MALMLGILFTCLMVWFSFTTEATAKTLYLCDNGKTVLLTDQASQGCPVYTPQAELTVVPTGATWADVEWAMALQEAASAPPWRQPLTASRTKVCEEWVELNLRTDGGLEMDTAENTRKWLALSRIVTATNLCDEYLTAQVYPRF